MKKRIPRIASLMIHRYRGGYVDVPLRNGGVERIDTVPKHAVVTAALIGSKGVVLPIRNEPKGSVAKAA